MPSYTPGQIARIVEGRRRDRSPVIRKMREIRDICNEDIMVPLPEMDTDERPASPNLILTAIEQNATRIASVQLNLKTPPKDPADDDSRKRAETRRHAILGWWEASDLEIADFARARWFIGYGSACTVIRPDPEQGLPVWEIRDPLDAYPPAPTGHPVRDMAPADCGFVHRYPWSLILARYPDKAPLVARGVNASDIDPSEPFEVIEWFDADESVLIACTNPVRNPWHYQTSQNVYADHVELDRMQNRIGDCQVIMPGRITLDRSRGQFDASIGMYVAHAKMTALGLIASERDVFPDMFLASRQPGETPRFLSGPPQDGRTGLWNEVEGIPMAVGQPMGAMTTNMLDRLERAEGITGGMPSEFAGESNTNIRTGRRGEQVMDAVLNFRMGEAQKILARARKMETDRAQAIAQSWFGRQQKTLFVEAVNRAVTYTPDDDFDSATTSVFYPIAGTDANNLVVATGQMVGIGEMSRRTSMELSPFIADAEAEHDRIQAEQLEQVAFATLAAQAQAGALAIPDLARIMDLVAKDKASLADAFTQVQKEAQERQASSGEPGTPTGPVPPGSPQAQPGLVPPGMGAEQPVAPPAAPPNLAQAIAMMGGR